MGPRVTIVEALASITVSLVCLVLISVRMMGNGS